MAPGMHSGKQRILGAVLAGGNGERDEYVAGRPKHWRCWLLHVLLNSALGLHFA